MCKERDWLRALHLQGRLSYQEARYNTRKGEFYVEANCTDIRAWPYDGSGWLRAKGSRGANACTGENGKLGCGKAV